MGLKRFFPVSSLLFLLPPIMNKRSINRLPLDSPTTITFSEEPPSQSIYLRSTSYSEDIHITVDLSATPCVDWRSMIVIHVLTVVATAASGILLPSYRPYFCSFGGSKGDFGFIFAEYSLGRILSTTPLGYLSDTMSCASILISIS